MNPKILHCCNLYQRMFFLYFPLVTYLPFRSLIHFEFILYTVLEYVVTLFFYMYLSSFPSTTYLRDCLFSIVQSCLLCFRLIDPSTWVYFWAFFPVLLICLSVLCQYHAVALQSEVRECDSSSSFCLPQDYFGYSRSFVFTYKLKKKLFQVCKKYRYFYRTALNLQIALDNMVISTILILPIQEHSISFHLFMLFSASLITILQFAEYMSFASQLGLFLDFLGEVAQIFLVFLN